jgi:hypothetical protein
MIHPELNLSYEENIEIFYAFVNIHSLTSSTKVNRIFVGYFLNIFINYTLKYKYG